MHKSWGLGAAALVCVHTLAGQMHKVAKPEDVVRAVGVYEWTGDMAKPAASRLIPVTLYINSRLEDAAIYMARPVPFALLTGNVYELDVAGVAKGTLDLQYSQHLQENDEHATAFDDGWFGYGVFVPPPAPKKVVALKPARTNGVITSSKTDDPDKPHFSSKSATPGTGAASGETSKDSAATETPAASTPSGDPDRPTMRRRPDASDQTAKSGAAGSSADTSATQAGSTPADDPDRPTMRRRADTSDTASKVGDSTGDTSAKRDDTPADDPDRPTLRRRSAADAKKTASAKDESSVTGPAVSLNEDPDRPTMKRGKPTSAPTAMEFAKLSGLPADLHQMVAVSDAANRPVHDFTRAWDDDAQHQEILTTMEGVARAQLAAYAPVPVTKPAAAKTIHPGNSKLRVAKPADAPAVALLDEELKSYTLSYGGAATYVYSAHTDGSAGPVEFVTVVAQVDMQGVPQVAMKSVTDADHLDRTPRMRFVDAVDVEASNRASLLFELRGQSARQFAVYRVIGARADQTFATGTTQ